MKNFVPSNIRIFRLIATMLLVSAFLPVVFNNLPPLVRSHHLWTILWGVAVFFLRPRVFFTKTMFLVLINWAIVLCIAEKVIWVNMAEEAKRMIYIEYYEIAVALSVTTYFRVSKDHEGWAMAVKTAFVCIIVTGVMSIIASYINPLFARDMIGIDEAGLSEKEELFNFKKFGGGEYGYYSGIVCLLPLLMYYYKNPTGGLWTRKKVIFYLFVLLFCLVRAQIFANLLIAALIMAMSIIGTRKLKRFVLLISVLAIILLMLPSDFYIQLLTNLSELFSKDSHIRFKLEDMALFIKNGAEPGVDTEAAIRVERFPLLWESFADAPFTGGEYYNHHLYWMNKLSTFGLLGFIPFIILLFSFFASEVRRYENHFKLYLILAILSIVFLGTIKALFGRELWYIFFVVAPGLYYSSMVVGQSSQNARTS